MASALDTVSQCQRTRADPLSHYVPPSDLSSIVFTPALEDFRNLHGFQTLNLSLNVRGTYRSDVGHRPESKTLLHEIHVSRSVRRGHEAGAGELLLSDAHAAAMPLIDSSRTNKFRSPNEVKLEMCCPLRVSL